jgi:hypothetical protein
MIYFIEMLTGDDFDALIGLRKIIKIGYTKNFNRRLDSYFTHNPFFKVLKVLKGPEFDQCCESRIHQHLINKRYNGRTEMFIKDDYVMSLINRINTKDDILNLYSGKELRNFKKYYNKYRGVLAKNKDLLMTAYDKDNEMLDNEMLVNEMLCDLETDIFSYTKKRFGIDLVDFTDDEKRVQEEFFKEYDKLKGRELKLKYVCEYYFNGGDILPILDLLPEKRFKEYLTVIGPEKCKACSYRLTSLNNILNVRSFDMSVLETRVFEEFEEGKAYSNSFIKEKLNSLYKEVDYRTKAKATDLSKYFKTRGASVQDGDRRVHGLRILSKLEKEGDKE